MYHHTTRQHAALLALLFGLIGGIGAMTPADADAAPGKKTRRYAIIVTNNGSVDEGVTPLRYADDDGARYYELFSSMADETHLLTTLDAESQRVFPSLAARSTPPTRRNLRATVKRVALRVAQDRKRGLRAEVYLVFAGHGNVTKSGEGYLSLSDGKLRRSELYRDVIRPLDASFTHLIIDACHAYYMVQARGGAKKWQDDRSGQTLNTELSAYLQRRERGKTLPATVGVIVSTSGTAEVHEWRRFRGGVFSHEVRSGLLGAADVNGDGDVTYDEMAAYLAAANAGVRTSRARVKASVRAPRQDTKRPLSRLAGYRKSTVLELGGARHGRMFVEDARGLRYADLHTSAQSKARLVLLRTPVSGRAYYLRTEKQQARVPLQKPVVQSGALAFAARTDQARSPVEDSFRAELFSIPFSSAFFAGYTSGREGGVGMSAGAPPATTPDSWRWRPELGYQLGRTVLPDRIDGEQHTLSLGLSAHAPQGWVIGPFAQYGWSRGADASAHRAALGVEGGWHHALSGTWTWGLRARLAPQLVLLREDTLRADPLSLRGAFAATTSWRVGASTELGLRLGASFDVITEVGAQQNSERVIPSPQLGLDVRF